MSNSVKHKGATFNLGGEDYVFAPLTIGAFERLEKEIEEVSKGGINEFQMARNIINIATSVLKRNYPSITREEVSELIDITNMQEIFIAMMNVSNPKTQEESNSAKVTEGEEKK